MTQVLSRFADLNIPSALKEAIEQLGFTQMTAIQAKALPPLLEGRDVIGQSKTGSGKTLAFALPILSRIHLKSRRPQSLILSPTRELASQVARDIRSLGRHYPGLHVLTLCGGMPSAPQSQALEKGAHIIVGTPGRVLDHVRRGRLNLDSMRSIVLDEADRMLDMGFTDEMESIMRAMPTARQTVFFSATFPPTIQEMSERYQIEPESVIIETPSESKLTIQEQLYTCALEEKPKLLAELLESVDARSAIVFCNFKINVAQLNTRLQEAGASVGALHGDLMQFERDRVLAQFRNQSIRVLVATDVAARGIDISGLDLVVNYDIPQTPDVYVHRIGRTGRAGRDGLAISIVSPKEQRRIDQIEEHTARTIEALKWTPRHRPAPEFTRAAMVTLNIGGGRKEKLRPGDILGALTKDAGFAGTDIGKIEIHDHCAYVAVSKAIAKDALAKLQAGKIKGRSFKASYL